MKDYVLELDRPRKLVYDFDAWDRITEKYGDPDQQEGFDASKLKITTKDVPSLVRIGLLWEDPGLTEEAVKDLLNKTLQTGKYTIIGIMQIAINAVFAQSGVEPTPLTKSAGTKGKVGPELKIPGSKKNAK